MLRGFPIAEIPGGERKGREEGATTNRPLGCHGVIAFGIIFGTPFASAFLRRPDLAYPGEPHSPSTPDQKFSEPAS